MDSESLDDLYNFLNDNNIEVVADSEIDAGSEDGGEADDSLLEDIEIPKNYFGAIYARSGLSVKGGLRPATCVSVIDSDYRGNVGLPIHNDSNFERTIYPKDRVAQIVFQQALIVDLVLVEELEETDRGNNGFGSTGR